MKIDNVAALRETLERMETQQLDDLLLEELRKEEPSGNLIRLISSILKERDKDTVPEIDASVQQAWYLFQKKTQPVLKKPKHVNSFFLKAASLMLVLFALVALMPQKAQAMNFFERFIAWTEDVFSLINPAEAKAQNEEYVFQTDNLGLQEVYDKVTELGVTVPVVPMWLPEGYELVECEVNKSPSKKYLTATFSNGYANIVYQLDIYSDNVTYEYYKSNSEIWEFELNDITYRIFRNKELQVAVWTIENIEGTVVIDCQEDVLNRILESIYTMEEN